MFGIFGMCDKLRAWEPHMPPLLDLLNCNHVGAVSNSTHLSAAGTEPARVRIACVCFMSRITSLQTLFGLTVYHWPVSRAGFFLPLPLVLQALGWSRKGFLNHTDGGSSVPRILPSVGLLGSIL